MSARVYYQHGSRMFYVRKTSMAPVTILDSRDTPGGFGDQQYRFRNNVDGREEGWTHESWFTFTEEEALARVKRYTEQERGD